MSALLGLALTAAVAGVERLVLTPRRPQVNARLGGCSAWRGVLGRRCGCRWAGGLRPAAPTAPGLLRAAAGAGRAGRGSRCAALAALRPGRLRAAACATPLLFGLWVLYFWQVGVTLGFDVPRVLLPSPGAGSGQSLIERAPTLAGDFVQTVLKAVLVGWPLGSALGFAVGVAIDRSALPAARAAAGGRADQHHPAGGGGADHGDVVRLRVASKAAVVVLMTFFPMLVATLAGLQAAGHSSAS